jgi:hypothetical protein
MKSRFFKLAGLTALCMVILALAVSPIFAATIAVFSGNIASGAQFDLYSVTIEGGTQVTATLVCDEIAPGDRPLDPVLSVYFPGSDPSDTINADVYNDDGFGLDDDPNGVDCNAFDSSRVIFTAPTTATYIFRADGFGSSTGPYTLSISGTLSTVGFNPGDDRINPEAHAPVAIYCRDGGVEVWRIVSATTGELSFSVGAADITAGENGAVLGSGGGATLSKTASGSLQVAATQSDGKGYLFVWDACPVGHADSYIIENGNVIHTASY